MQLGVYQHYKGNFYKVLGIAKHTETNEELVVYQAVYDKKELWVRPLAIFIETINIDGNEVPRFRFVESS